MVSLIIFIGAILIFIGLFSQTVQTAIVYQRHSSMATKNSDLLDTMLLNPGLPDDWGTNSGAQPGSGLQDPEFTQYQLSPFSLMRLTDSTGNAAEYDKTGQGNCYTEVGSEFGASLLTPKTQALNYSFASQLLGINGTYGFQLTLTPDITVAVTQNSGSPLSLSISASGTGFPFANASINYCLFLVNLTQTYPAYSIVNGVAATDVQGNANVVFQTVTDPNQPYAFIAYVHLDGVMGVGYHIRESETEQYVVPIIKNTATQEVALAHSYDINASGPWGYSLNYTATFLILKQDYTLSELPLSPQSQMYGILTSGSGYGYTSVYPPSYTTGILVVTYQISSTQGGVVMMPWGISSLGFPVTFGGNSANEDWVTTDIRQVTIGGIAYQARLALWNTNGVSA